MLDRKPSQLSRTRKLAFSLAPVLVLAGVVEMVVRLTGSAEVCPAVGSSPSFVCDPLLYFKTNPELVILGEPLNKDGFRGREFGSKKQSVIRVLALGDSCTFGVAPPAEGLYLRDSYPHMLERLIERNDGPGRVEVLNAASPGYNSYQGLMLLRTKLRDLAPDVITVRFGWNDHLMSNLGREEGAYRDSMNPIIRSVETMLLQTALYPFAIRLRLEARARLFEEIPEAPGLPQEWKPNMSILEYRNALRSIVELGGELGASVWLLTAPIAFSNDAELARFEALPDDAIARRLLFFNGVQTFARMRNIHDSYTNATRKVARELETPLVDMDALYRHAENSNLFSITDGVHPTLRGHLLEAKALRRRLVQEGILGDTPPPHS